jgi:LacI family transcriptional regulator, galactose operon repressor
MSKGKITLQDIAKEANVSLTAASLHLNGQARKHRISQATCEKIEEVIKKHNYNPNIHARAIASKKTYLIGVILPGGVDGSFWMDIISGIEEVIAKEQYHMLLSVSHYDVGKELEAFEFMKNKGVDGFIFAPVIEDNDNSNADYARKLSKEKPIVTIAFPVEGIPGVYTDGIEGGRIAAKKFCEAGHRKVAYLGVRNRKYDLRGMAFLEAMKNYGIKVADYLNIDNLLDNHEKFTGVFCFSDSRAMTMYCEAAKRGLSIPEDLSIIGYDNMFFSELLVPSLTTIHQNKKELGIVAAKKLMRLSHGEKLAEMSSEIFPPKLVEGGSVLNIKESGKVKIA